MQNRINIRFCILFCRHGEAGNTALAKTMPSGTNAALQQNILSAVWDCEKICALHFKICLTYFKICQTYFFLVPTRPESPSAQGLQKT